MFEYDGGMADVADRNSLDNDPGPVAGCRPTGLELIQVAIAAAAAVPAESFGRGELVDEIGGIESLKNALDALGAEWVLAFARGEVVELTKAGVVEPEKLERSIAAQVGLACRVSPTEGRKRVRIARDLDDGL